MSEPGPGIRNVSDTARWAAEFRARESERTDALFRDPFARRLSGERGRAIVDGLPGSARQAWAWVTRTYLYDRFILDAVAGGIDTIVNLAAGLDARPYRMGLPGSLNWIEIDLPDLLRSKEQALEDARPSCRLERRPLDLADAGARREALRRIGAGARRAVAVTEGLLIYFSRDEVAALAGDLAGVDAFEAWIIDIASPGLMRMMQKQAGDRLEAAGAPFRFAPEEGPGFFRAHGWEPADVRGLLKTAAGLGRLSFGMRLLALLPESTGRQGSRPWSAVCRLERPPGHRA